MIRKAVITLAVALTTSAATIAVDKRVIGGEEAKKGEFPFIVSISRSAQGGHNCGGSLLDSTTVLTAAHCLGSAYYVRAGTQDLSTSAVVGKLEFVKEHPEYNLGPQKGTYANDVAILKLSTPIDNIQYATLPEAGSDPVVKSTAIAAGWGAQSVNGGAVNKLHKVAIPVRERQDCWDTTPAITGRDTIVCAGGNGKSVWRYDSGGPLIDKETGHLIGLMSLSAKDAKNPASYIRVGSYIPFIKQYLGSIANPNPNSPPLTEAYEKLLEEDKLLH